MATKNRLSKRQYFLFAVALITYIFFEKSYNRILNYPNRLLFGLGGIFFISIFLYKITRFKNSIWKDEPLVKIFAILIRCLSAVIFSWFLTGILFIPLNYYIIDTAKNTAAYTLDLKITGLGTKRGTQKIFYEFNSSGRTVYLSAQIIGGIYKSYDNYRLRVTVRKAILGTLVIEDWDIVRKT